MGQNFVAILAHHLPLDDSLLTVLPDILDPANAPKLAIAVQHLAAAEYSRRAEDARKYPSARLAPLASIDEPWVVEQPGRALFLNEQREAVPTKAPSTQPLGWQPVGIAEHMAEGWSVEVFGPGNVWLSVFRRCLTVSCVERWGVFLSDPSLRIASRHVCRELARTLGSPVALYVSEYWEPTDEIYSGAPIEEVITAMAKTLGPPATTIESIYQKNENGTWSGDGYYIDTFADLGDMA